MPHYTITQEIQSYLKGDLDYSVDSSAEEITDDMDFPPGKGGRLSAKVFSPFKHYDVPNNLTESDRENLKYETLTNKDKQKIDDKHLSEHGIYFKNLKVVK